MRRLLIGLLGLCLVVAAVFLGRPVTRASLGIVEANNGPAVCAAPGLADIRSELKQGEFGCTTPGGCQNTEHVSLSFLPYAVASLNAYGTRTRFNLPQLDQGWQSRGRPFRHWNGLGYSVYTKTTSTTYDVLVAYRGTDNLVSVLPAPEDAIANMSWLTQWFNPWDQYRMAREEFAKLRSAILAETKGKTARFYVTGHSLGGGLAQHIARGFPCVSAVVFNTSCVSNRIRFSEPYMDNQIVDIRENRDWLSKTVCLPAGMLGWGSRHQIYEANWINDRVKEWTDEIDSALNQHKVGRMSFAMSRMVLCCAQRSRLNSNAGCACRPNVLAGVEGVRRLFCEGRKPLPPDAKRIDPCDFSPVQAGNDASCRLKC